MVLLTMMGGMNGKHYMSLDILGFLFRSVAKQDWPLGEPYRDPKHTSAKRWKATLDKFKEERVDRLGKHLDCQVFVNGRVLPSCLRDSKYFEFAFPIDSPLANELIPALPALSSAAIRNSVPWPNATGGGSSLPAGAMAMSMGSTLSSGTVTPLTASATGTPTKQGGPGGVSRDSRTWEEIEENFAQMLAQDMDDVKEYSATPKEGSPTNEGGATDAEITGTMSGWSIQSPMDSRRVVDESVAQHLTLKPGTLPNLQMHAEKQKELDQL